MKPILKAFSITELLVTVAILSFVMAMAATTFGDLQRYSKVTNSVTSATDKVRTTFNIITTDLANAGLGFKDYPQLDVRFDNGEGNSPMLMVENLRITNGHSDITINYFAYNPVSEENVSFLLAFDGAPFAGTPTFCSDNLQGEMDNLQAGDIYLIYPMNAVTNPAYFDGTWDQSHWNIPGVLNSAAILQLSPAGAPNNRGLSETQARSAFDFCIQMEYVSDGFLASGGSQFQASEASEGWIAPSIMADAVPGIFYGNPDAGGLPFTTEEGELQNLLIARKLGPSNAFRTVRYWVNADNALIRTSDNRDEIVIEDVLLFEIRAGLDTSITDVDLVMNADLDGSVSRNTNLDDAARWIDTTDGGDDIDLLNRHGLALRVKLEVDTSQIDVSRDEANVEDRTKKAIMETQIRLQNSLPRGVINVRRN
jgi:hypothetical protein